jgi:hypothetical protein
VESAKPGFWKIQLQALQPHAAKVLFSSQTSSLDMAGILPTTDVRAKGKFSPQRLSGFLC